MYPTVVVGCVPSTVLANGLSAPHIDDIGSI
jgi:hypothetical protein